MALKSQAAPAAPGGALDAAAVRRRGWTVTVLFLAFMIINFADKAVTGLAGVEIKRDLGLTEREFGLVQSSFFWLFAVGAIVVGGLSDRIRARWLVAGLMVVWCLSLAPLAGPIGLTALIGCRMLLGFAEGPAPGLANRITHTWFPPSKRALPGSLIITGASLGPLLAAPLLTWVIDSYSWHLAFALLAGAGLLWLVLWFAFGGEGPAGTTEEAAGTPAAAAVALPDRVPYRLIFTRGTVLGLMALSFCSYMSTTLKVSWLPLYLKEGLGYRSGTAGLLVTLPYAAAVVLTVAVGWYSGRLVRRGVTGRVARGLMSTALIAGAGVAMVAFTQADRGALQMGLITLAFSLNTAAWGVSFAAISDVVPPGQRGTVMGAYVAVYSMGGVLAPILLGEFVASAATKADGYGQGFVVTGVVMVIGALLSMAFINPEKDARTIIAHAERGTGR